MNVFPDGETAPADQEMADLPEGITSQNNGETEAPSEAPTNENGETYPVYDEEFIEEGVQYPELMPGDPSAESAPPEGQTAAPSQGSTEAPSQAPAAESSASGNGGGAEKPSEAKADTNTYNVFSAIYCINRDSVLRRRDTVWSREGHGTEKE